MRPHGNSRAAGDALEVLATLALATFVVSMLLLAREILMPLALAALLTFLLSPLVTRLERWIGRVAAVVVVVSMIFAGTGMAGWVLTQQLIDLAARLPDYKENIAGKLHAFHLPKGLRAFQRTVEELRSELPGGAAPAVTVQTPPGSDAVVPVPGPAKRGDVSRVEVVAAPASGVMDLVRSILAPLMGPLGTAALVLLLVVCMLLQRDDLRRRIIRLVGQGHISATTRALDDAGRRVSRYLLMQLVVNVSYGVPVGIGLWFIGVPNAFLWGGFATVLRFVPYVGPWVAAFFPVTLSLAVSPDWSMPLQAVALFVVLELVINNLMEPWLYGNSTGVTPIALIVAAVFWTWLWGPVGLVLATPLTVCLVVLGRHVPQLAFLGVLLSDEDALTPAEDCYQRLLSPGEHDETDLVDSFLATGSIAELYENVLLPVLATAENDARQHAIDREQLAALHQSLRDIVQDLATRDDASLVLEAATQDSRQPDTAPRRLLCLPVRAERDELAAMMLSQLLQGRGHEAWSVPPAPAKNATADFLELLSRSPVDAVLLSVLAPTTALHARYLCLRLRARFPSLPIVVGLWRSGERAAAATRRLREAGASEVVTTLIEAAEQLATTQAPAQPDPRPLAVAASG